MYMMHDQIFGHYPDIYMQFRSPLTDFPMVFNVTGDCTVGNSSGFGADSVRGGIGEYVERYHFYNHIDSQYRGTLASKNSSALTESCIKLINQVKKTKSSIAIHEFDLLSVTNIVTAEKAFLPMTMVSLAHSQSQDRDFIPFVDSSGQAAHISKEQAFSTAFKEFIERQSLVGAWLSGKADCQIEITTDVRLGETNKIIRQFEQSGDLYAFQINNHLPGYCIIVFYFSHSEKDTVQYSVGMAADFCPVMALERAVQELWQSYTFMYLNAENPENLDERYKYLNELISFNTHKTKNIIPFFNSNHRKILQQEYFENPVLDSHYVIKAINLISNEIFAYETKGEFLERQFYFCKILSPDFFLHMGIMMPLNLDNLYANLLHIDPNMKIQNPIPFP